MRASGRGFAFSMEAFLSLFVALLLISFVRLGDNAGSFSRASLLEYQKANDIAETLWAAGDYARIGDWIEGNSTSGEIVRGRLLEISEGTGDCVVLENDKNDRKLEAGCRRAGDDEKEGNVVSITRVIVGRNGIYGARISVS